MIRDTNPAALALPVDADAGGAGRASPFAWGRRSGASLAVVLAVSLATFAVVCYLHFGHHVRAYQLMDDPVSFAGVKWYTGLLSNAVVLLWCASAAVCVFAALVLRGAGDAALHQWSQFFELFAVLNLWLTVDDLLLVHEQVARLLVGRGAQHAGEGVEFVLYGAVIAGCIWRFRRTIARTESVLLVGAIASLLASAAIDVGFQLELGGNNYFRETVLSVWWGPSLIDISEELLKLNGAMLWFAYFLRAGLSSARAVVSARPHDLGRKEATSA